MTRLERLDRKINKINNGLYAVKLDNIVLYGDICYYEKYAICFYNTNTILNTAKTLDQLEELINTIKEDNFYITR